MRNTALFIVLSFISACGFGGNDDPVKYEFMGCTWLISPDYQLVFSTFQRDPNNANERYKSITFSPEPLTTDQFEHQSHEVMGEYMELLDSFVVDDFHVGFYRSLSERMFMGVEMKNEKRWTLITKSKSIAMFLNVELDELKEIAAECVNFPEELNSVF